MGVEELTPRHGLVTDSDISYWRSEFPIVETCTYLVSHSLGAMPRKTSGYLQQFAESDAVPLDYIDLGETAAFAPEVMEGECSA